MSTVIRDLAASLPVPESGIASSPLLDLAGSTKLVLFAMDGGQEISPHAAPFPARVLLLAGGIDVAVGNQWTSLAPGASLDLPAGEPHGIRAREASHFLLTMLRALKPAPAAAEPHACGHDHGQPGTAQDLAIGPGSPVLQQWMREHDEALRRLGVMEAGARSGDWGAVVGVARWLYQELKPHNEAEEQFLFPLMDPFFAGQHGPTDCMRSEHRLIWDFTLRLQEALASGVPVDAPAAADLAFQVASNLRAHIEKENQVLYPMAERILGPEQLRRLEESYAAR